ncbi:hypothetical protein [Gemella morbillorum]|uniref:hypothetical protein n=1 Tax=Gemella morbillorum TaxID=29391 RepID=UPI001CB34A6A|nr:hypothetical protein [Gemella morbillorum]MBF1213182.1 hypothetical protein [Gemella morbillorum]
MKKIITLIMSIIIISILAGCGITGKGSRSWIEDKVANIEKVYPTENLEDLFEKFPKGFIIRQTRLFKEEDKSYSVDLELIGNEDTKKIEGKVRKVLLESKPYYKETIEEESKLEYIKGKNLVLEKPELAQGLLFKNYFIFQKLKLDKGILKNLSLERKQYLSSNGTYGIDYNIRNKIVNEYFDLIGEESVIMRLSGYEGIEKEGYVQGIVIKNTKKEINYMEEVRGK